MGVMVSLLSRRGVQVSRVFSFLSLYHSLSLLARRLILALSSSSFRRKSSKSTQLFNTFYGRVSTLAEPRTMLDYVVVHQSVAKLVHLYSSHRNSISPPTPLAYSTPSQRISGNAPRVREDPVSCPIVRDQQNAVF